MILVKEFKSQTIQLPSELADTAWSLEALILISKTYPLCSLREASSTCVYLPILHILTSPSLPPEMILLQSEVTEIAVTPWLWASLMTYMSFPDWG